MWSNTTAWTEHLHFNPKKVGFILPDTVNMELVINAGHCCIRDELGGKVHWRCQEINLFQCIFYACREAFSKTHSTSNICHRQDTRSAFTVCTTRYCEASLQGWPYSGWIVNLENVLSLRRIMLMGDWFWLVKTVDGSWGAALKSNSICQTNTVTIS